MDHKRIVAIVAELIDINDRYSRVVAPILTGILDDPMSTANGKKIQALFDFARKTPPPPHGMELLRKLAAEFGVAVREKQTEAKSPFNLRRVLEGFEKSVRPILEESWPIPAEALPGVSLDFRLVWESRPLLKMLETAFGEGAVDEDALIQIYNVSSIPGGGDFSRTLAVVSRGGSLTYTDPNTRLRTGKRWDDDLPAWRILPYPVLVYWGHGIPNMSATDKAIKVLKDRYFKKLGKATEAAVQPGSGVERIESARDLRAMLAGNSYRQGSNVAEVHVYDEAYTTTLLVFAAGKIVHADRRYDHIFTPGSDWKDLPLEKLPYPLYARAGCAVKSGGGGW